MPQVAAEAGVLLRTLYRYFPTREAMFDAVGDHVVARLGLPREIEGPQRISAPVFLESARRGAQEPAPGPRDAVDQAGPARPARSTGGGGSNPSPPRWAG